MSNVDPAMPRVVVPFAFIQPNTDNHGLKDFTPAIVPSDTPDPEEIQHERATSRNTGEAGDDRDPKVDSSAQESAPTSPKVSEVATQPAIPETPAPAEKEVFESTPKNTSKE